MYSRWRSMWRNNSKHKFREHTRSRIFEIKVSYEFFVLNSSSRYFNRYLEKVKIDLKSHIMTATKILVSLSTLWFRTKKLLHSLHKLSSFLFKHNKFSLQRVPHRTRQVMDCCCLVECSASTVLQWMMHSPLPSRPKSICSLHSPRTSWEIQYSSGS